jgi:hypothetical protein
MLFTFFKINKYHNWEANCTEPFPSIGVPCFIHDSGHDREAELGVGVGGWKYRKKLDLGI